MGVSTANAGWFGSSNNGYGGYDDNEEMMDEWDNDDDDDYYRYHTGYYNPQRYGFPAQAYAAPVTPVK